MQIQINIAEIPATIVLDNVQNAIAFQKTSPTAFIDRQKDLPEAQWLNGKMELEGVAYPYQHWHKIEQEGEGVFKKYFKEVIKKGHNPYGHIFNF